MKQCQQILLTLTITFGLLGSASAQQIQVNKDNRTIAITTSDTAKAEAEVARVDIGFIVYAPDSVTAYASASKTSNGIVAALIDEGVAKSAIESDTQEIEQELPSSDLPQSERDKHRFKVSQSWKVTTLAKDAAEILNTAINAGANNSGDIDWSVKDEDALQAEASAKALEKARQIAERMATGLNAKLGLLVYASNEAPQRGFGFGIGRVDSVTATVAGPPPVRPLSISPQQVTKTATVYAVFALQ